LTDPHAPATTFNCAAPGIATITLSATSPGCDQEASATINCN
jgi:hypothetical protein